MWKVYGSILCAYAIASVAGQNGTKPGPYPPPPVTGAGGWEQALTKARAFLQQLTADEKIKMITGAPGPCVGNILPIPRLNFSGLCLQDGPLQIRQVTYASVFPAGLSTAASWDRNLIHQRGVFLGEEYKGKGSHIALGPVVGPLGRSPFGGRNWEGFSPDSYLSGVAVEETIKGMQESGVQACTKHYILNEQETQRNPSSRNGTTILAVSSNLDDRTMHEAYLWPFANAVKAGTSSIMCSYNRINGTYGCENPKTLNDLLKTELGFQGYVMSDWGATHSGVPAISAGLDMNMPGGTTWITENSTVAARVDDMILRIMTPYYALSQDSGYPPIDSSAADLQSFPFKYDPGQYTLGPVKDVRDGHAGLIRELGAAGTVLLKNTNNALPLKKPKNIAVFGNDAADFTQGGYPISLAAGPQTYPGGNYDIGTLAVGGGSGTGRFTYVIPPLDAIKARGQQWGALVQYVTSNYAITHGALSTIKPSPPDVCLVFLKSWASEGSDRTTLVAEWNSTAIVQQVASICNNTVVVLHGASPNTLPFRNNANVTAILAAHMPGQETGNSIADVLWGDVNPSGRLPYTIANSESDYAKNLVNSSALQQTTDPNAWQADFNEGLLIDYKEFDAQNKSVAYEFGFGLSYTTFSLSSLKIQNVVANATRTPSASAPILPGGNVELWSTLVQVTATVQNTGQVDGAAVLQLYISLPASEAGQGTPVRVLRGFEKVPLGAGEAQSVVFNLMRRDLSFWDAAAQNWRVPAGSIGVAVGFSSRDLRLMGDIRV